RSSAGRAARVAARAAHRGPASAFRGVAPARHHQHGPRACRWVGRDDDARESGDSRRPACLAHRRAPSRQPLTLATYGDLPYSWRMAATASDRVELRLSPEVKQELETASSLLGITTSAFVKDAA